MKIPQAKFRADAPQESKLEHAKRPGRDRADDASGFGLLLAQLQRADDAKPAKAPQPAGDGDRAAQPGRSSVEAGNTPKTANEANDVNADANRSTQSASEPVKSTGAVRSEPEAEAAAAEPLPNVRPQQTSGEATDRQPVSTTNAETANVQAPRLSTTPNAESESIEGAKADSVPTALAADTVESLPAIGTGKPTEPAPNAIVVASLEVLDEGPIESEAKPVTVTQPVAPEVVDELPDQVAVSEKPAQEAATATKVEAPPEEDVLVAEVKPSEHAESGEGENADNAETLPNPARVIAVQTGAEGQSNNEPTLARADGPSRIPETATALAASSRQPVEAEAPKGAEATPVQRVIAPDKATLYTLPESAVRGVRYLIQRGEQTMHIRLVPESLGELKLEVTSSHDTLSIRLASANPAVREMLHAQVHSLREMLAQDGLNTANISVTNDATSAQTQSGNAHRQSWQSAYSARRQDAPGPGYKDAAGQSPPHPRKSAAHVGVLNMYA